MKADHSGNSHNAVSPIVPWVILLATALVLIVGLGVYAILADNLIALMAMNAVCLLCGLCGIGLFTLMVLFEL